MTPDKPTRRGFLGACSAAAAALGLTARATPARPPIADASPEDLKVIETAIAKAKVLEISLTTTGSGYTSPPSVVFSGGGGSGAIATLTPHGVEIKTR